MHKISYTEAYLKKNRKIILILERERRVQAKRSCDDIMQIKNIKIKILQEHLDGVKESLRNVGNRYIENELPLFNIKRHHLARAGNATIALKECHLITTYDSEFNIIDLSLNTKKLFNLKTIFDAISEYVEQNSYIEIEENGQVFIYLFKDKKCIELNDEKELIQALRKTPKIIYCEDCRYYDKELDGCIQTTKTGVDVIFTRNADDFCSRASIE